MEVGEIFMPPNTVDLLISFLITLVIGVCLELLISSKSFDLRIAVISGAVGFLFGAGGLLVFGLQSWGFVGYTIAGSFVTAVMIISQHSKKKP